MAHVCPPLRAVGPSAGSWPGIPGSAGDQTVGLPRGCELCGSAGAGVLSRANGAVLCAVCDHNVGMINPLGGQGVLLEHGHKDAALALGCDDQVKVEFVSAAAPDGLGCGSGQSWASVASEGSMLKCTPDDHLLDALNDPAVLELFPASMDGGMEGFQGAELDSEWIETLEREGPGLCAQPPPMDKRMEVQYDGRMPTGEQPGPSVAVLNAARLQQQQRELQQELQQQQEQQQRQQQQQQQQQQQPSLACFNGAYGAGPLPATPQCPMPVMVFLPMGPWDGMAAAGFKPLAPPSMASLQASQSLVDRKARVARYREKRKHRSFENKIRYTSRKLYAENRPRIKGRFARPDELEAYLKAKELGEGRQRCDEEEEDEGGDEDMQLLPEC